MSERAPSLELPQPAEVEAEAASLGLATGAAELHGAICGWLAGGGATGPGWLGRVMADDAQPPPPADGATLDVYARIEGAVAEGFEIANGEAIVDGQLTGLPPLDLLGHPDALRLWQMAGGTATLRQLDASADGLTLSATGEAALDDTGRLDAMLALSSRGLVERFPGLAQDPAAAIFLGRPDAEGVYTQNLSARGGTVFVGILPVMGLAPLF